MEENLRYNGGIIFSRRINITPSGVIYNMKEGEMSNRVMRIFEKNAD